MGGRTHNHRPKQAQLSSKGRPYPPSDEEKRTQADVRIGLIVYTSYPHSIIYIPPKQIGPKDGVFEFTGSVIQPTACSQCAMQLQASAPRIIAAHEFIRGGGGGDEAAASGKAKAAERKDKGFAHMHVACAPASLLEAACRHYGARRMADLPGFTSSPNRPYIGQLIRYVVSRFVPAGEKLEEDGLPKKQKSTYKVKQPKKTVFPSVKKPSKKAAKVATMQGTRMKGHATPTQVQSAAAAEAKKQAAAVPFKVQEMKQPEPAESMIQRTKVHAYDEEVKVREELEHKTAY